MGIIKKWYRYYFSDPQIITLFAMIIISGLAIYFLSDIFMPVFLALAIVYIISFPIRYLERKGLKYWQASSIVGVVLVIAVVMGIIYLVPLLISQAKALFHDLPNILNKVENNFPNFITQIFPFLDKEEIIVSINNVKHFIFGFLNGEINNLVKVVSQVFKISIYLILIPIIVFFVIKDKKKLIDYWAGFLPNTDHQVTYDVLGHFRDQLNNYVYGKIIEVVIMSTLIFIAFSFFGLKFSLILAILIAFSAFIPYIGVLLSSIPLVIVVWVQFGVSDTFFFILITHLILQIIDGNVLVPIIFSKTNNLHPFSIILAVLFFGGFWGFWGVLFAIPLATLLKAVFNAWKYSIEKRKQVFDTLYNPLQPVEADKDRKN